MAVTPIVMALAALTAGSCASEQWVIQRSSKGAYSHGFKYVGVHVEHADVRVKGWRTDSAAIAVNMVASVRRMYSFAVDSVDDSLLLVGKYRGPADTNIRRPEAVVEILYSANVTVQSEGSIYVEDATGPLWIEAFDTVTYTGSPNFPAMLRSSKGEIRIVVRPEANVEIDAESGAGGAVKVETERFHGIQQRNRAKGVIGDGGVRITARGARGVRIVDRLE